MIKINKKVIMNGGKERDSGNDSLVDISEIACQDQQQNAVSSPDRSPASRAIIVHPQFKDRHPIYNLLSTKQLERRRRISVPGFPIPFDIHQNFVASDQDLGSIAWSGGIAAAAYLGEYASARWQRDPTNTTKPWGQETLLELGCGTAALVSQCAALCGYNVVMTDLPHVLEWACNNAKQNSSFQWAGHPRLQESLYKSKPGSVSPLLSAKPLRWGETSDLPSEEFDMVVVADCLYAMREDNGSDSLMDKLLLTLRGLLANDRTKLLVSYQNRTGQERKFVHETLPFAFPDYVVAKIHPSSAISDLVHAMAWVLPKREASTDGKVEKSNRQGA